MPSQAQLDALEAGRTGGDRWAPAAPIFAAIAAALGEAPDDEIREAFGLGGWRAVTAAHRARYGEYFTPRVYRAMVEAMAAGVNAGRLHIKDFAVFTKGPAPAGQLFPMVDNFGPSDPSNMVLVDVTIAPGDDDFAGGPISGVREGSDLAWYDQQAQSKAIWAAEYVPIDGELFGVVCKLTARLNYGGLYEVDLPLVRAAVVRGHLEWVPSRSGTVQRADLVIDDGAPELSGQVDMPFGLTGFPVTGPHDEVVVMRDREYINPAFPAWQIAEYWDSLAEGVLSPGAVHSLDVEDLPLRAAAFVNCFPRKKWVERIERTGTLPNGTQGAIVEYLPVRWIDRAEWGARFGANLAMWENEGRAVPPELLGERWVGPRVFAKFAPAFIEALNEAPE